MKLDKYEKKRDFSQTPEPSQQEGGSDGILRFVVQKHRATRLHFDLRLELDGVLKSWAVPKGPTLDPDEKRLAVMVEDHPYDYKNFEGRIPSGNYGAGTVTIWDEGTCNAYENREKEVSQQEFRRGLANGDLKFVLHGNKLKGKFALVKMKSEQDNNWLLLKKKDDYAVSDFQLDSLNDPFPKKIKPMLATLVEEPFDHPDWLFEIKLDGYRAIADVSGGTAELYSRNFTSFTEKFAQITKALSNGVDAVYDGEIVVLDEKGRSRFQLLQNFAKQGEGRPVFFVFDLLYLEGKDLRSLPLIERKEKLKQFLPESDDLKYVDYIKEEGKSFFALAQENGLEGIIAKRSSGSYLTGKRTTDWQKIKVAMRQDAIICGFTKPKGSRKHFGALVLGVYNNKKLIHIGNCGTGFDEETLAGVHEQLKPLVQKESPFKEKVPAAEKITWVQPKLVCEVRFSEWTDDGIMRHPVFLGLQTAKIGQTKTSAPVHKNPETEIKELSAESDQEITLNNQPLKLTNLNKIFWPQEKYSKRDVINYYQRMAPYILPYLIDRPQSLHRTPDGIIKEGFYQKNVSEIAPDWVETHSVYSESNDKEVLYLLCQNEQTLIYMANLGCIEINPWLSRTQNLDHPDYLVIDLDPEDISFDKVVEAALAVNDLLTTANIVCYPKTSGATGLHIYIPLQAKYNYEVVREFSRLIATLVHNEVPDFTSIERSPKKRQQKVYLDFLQNRQVQTLASVYSLRPRPKAPVSTPLLWEEVKPGLDPQDFTIDTIHRRVEEMGDLFKGVLGPGIDIAKSIKEFEKRLR